MHDAQDVNEGSFVLVQAYRLQQSFLAAPEPEPSAWWLVMERAEQRAHGFPYKATSWFGSELPEHIRMRCRRAIDRLEANGLIVTWRKHGKRLTHLQLTAAGTQLAVELLAKHDGVDAKAMDPVGPPEAAPG